MNDPLVGALPAAPLLAVGAAPAAAAEPALRIPEAAPKAGP
ncbi:hypothetical protein [Streptomyces sp. SM11]|nr:hypothetical protein [Streptomyces sp. SM11]